MTIRTMTQMFPSGGADLPLVVRFTGERPDPKKTIFFLGGATVGLEKSFPIFDELARAGFPVAGLDYRGMTPATKADFSKTGLGTRILDAQLAKQCLRTALGVPHPILWGHSMGGHIAAHLSDMDPMVLSSPAAYTSRVLREHVCFGPGFTNLIREPGSWQDSEVLRLMEGFCGDLLVLTMRDDEVVPPEVPKAYFRSAIRVRTKCAETLPFPHGTTFDPTEAGAQKRAAMVATFVNWWERIKEEF